MLARSMRPGYAPPLLLVAVLLTALALAAPARAQHGMTVGPRPLHLRLAETDVVAIGTVEAVRDGRVTIGDAVVLRGEAQPRFELKHAPSREIPFAVGVSLLLPLRGAREPYVLVDDARELIPLRDPAAVTAWRAGIAALLAAGDDRKALTDVYVAWLEGDDDAMRETAGAALLDPRAGLLPVSPERAVERARAALDPELPLAARRISAILAGGRAEGTAAMLADFPAAALDAQVLETALRNGIHWRVDGVEDTLLRALEDDRPAVRRAVVKLIESSGSGAGLARLPEVAAHDADEGVRREAIQVLSARGMLGELHRGE
jgi:hypothetical protein